MERVLKKPALIRRERNTRCDGTPFTEPLITRVWEKGNKDSGFTFFRKDVCGTTMAQMEFGTTSRYGWEIDHIIPVSEGGTDDIDNLQPLHWENNIEKDDAYPVWKGKFPTINGQPMKS